jgi:hypothetical protein
MRVNLSTDFPKDINSRHSRSAAAINYTEPKSTGTHQVVIIQSSNETIPASPSNLTTQANSSQILTTIPDSKNGALDFKTKTEENAYMRKKIEDSQKANKEAEKPLSVDAAKVFPNATTSATATAKSSNSTIDEAKNLTHSTSSNTVKPLLPLVLPQKNVSQLPQKIQPPPQRSKPKETHQKSLNLNTSHINLATKKPKTTRINASNLVPKDNETLKALQKTDASKSTDQPSATADECRSLSHIVMMILTLPFAFGFLFCCFPRSLMADKRITEVSSV